MSPATCLFGRLVKDLIPILPGKYCPHATWKETLQLREEALRHRHLRHQEKCTEHTKALPPLQVGDHVRIQNQTGSHPLKWDRTGVVVEVRQFHQYLIKIDGSGRQTLRNRKFLRKFVPMSVSPKRRSILDDINSLPPNSALSGNPSTQPLPPTQERALTPATPTDCEDNTPPLVTPNGSPENSSPPATPTRLDVNDATPTRLDTDDAPLTPVFPPLSEDFQKPSLSLHPAPMSPPKVNPKPLQRSIRMRSHQTDYCGGNQPLTTLCDGPKTRGEIENIENNPFMNYLHLLIIIACR